MKLENQVVSLDLAKRLKELGVKQDSYGYWANGRVWPFVMLDFDHLENAVAAFTVAELGEMLSEGMTDSHMMATGRWTCEYLPSVTEDGSDKEVRVDADTEADARAKMLIYLIENNRIPV
jgi:hypothetical protein